MQKTISPDSGFGYSLELVDALIPVSLDPDFTLMYLPLVENCMAGLVKALVLVGILSVLAGCCALPDMPGPVGIPGC